ncbi:prepilin-type N-terminal cleavage/methylation domain-containing protein [Candidatus Uabimicrobium sp. HlEnr_7]|uniref:type IV pilus modification PilV family protein n=1 Tax=Candidatus Uabimicrobium helgolandensis TaxID=3095367 RepID=UPI0035585FF4
MRQKSTSGFTLIEILISLGILVFGVVGILTLFPAGIKSTKKAAEETYAAFIADSVYAALRASASQMAPGDNLIYFHDGINDTSRLNEFVLPLVNKSIGIPSIDDVPTTGPVVVDIDTRTGGDQDNYAPLLQGGATGNFAFLGQNDNGFNVSISDEDEAGTLGQFSYNIQISYPDDNGQPQQNPKGLFDVMIRIRRGERLIKRFPSKIFLPTNNDN